MAKTLKLVLTRATLVVLTDVDLMLPAPESRISLCSAPGFPHPAGKEAYASTATTVYGERPKTMAIVAMAIVMAATIA